ncbi:MAG: SDR family NAD(P)-dependent oxidoreductase [Acidobacteriota bacterium]
MLKDKVVLITGAKGGLGNYVTQAFLDAQAIVVGTARSIKAEDFPHKNFTADPAELGSSDQAAAVVKRVLDRTGRIDALVHLVGAFAGGPSVAETDDDVLARMVNVNLDAFFYMARAVLPVMQKQGSGSVLAIGSRTANEPAAGLGAYSASKAALVSLVGTIALEYKSHGISANVLLPGTMDTPANRAAMPQADVSQWVQPSQVAAMLVHLASDAASQVTGAVIPIYGKGL